MNRHVLSTLCFWMIFSFGATVTKGLEGSWGSTHNDWKNVPAHAKVDARTRQAELEARSTAIANDITRLKARLKTTPSADKMQELHKALQNVYKGYGWEPNSQLVYGRRSMDPMLKGQNRMPEPLLKAFIQLNKDLKARGVDLIILPLPPTPHFHAHTLVDGIGPEQEYFPGWTQMTIEMLEHDLEVVDSLEAFRKEAENPVLVSWVNDFHTGSTGRQIAARALAERLQRYDFARELVKNRNKWSTEVKEKSGAMWPQRITTVNNMFKQIGKEKASDLPPGTKTWKVRHPGKLAILRPDAPDLGSTLKQRRFQYMTLKKPPTQGLMRTDFVMIGDSQLHSAVYGDGLPAFIMAEVGGYFRWGSKSWSGFSPPQIYQEVVPNNAVTPRVVVLTFLPKYFWGDGKRYGPRPLPPPKAAGQQKAIAGPQDVTVRINQVSSKPTQDASRLDYDEALMHVSATIMDGPLKGRVIGLRYWILHDGRWTQADRSIRKGMTMKLTILPWQEAITANRSLAQHQIFDSTDQDLMVPVFWASKGRLGSKTLLGK